MQLSDDEPNSDDGLADSVAHLQAAMEQVRQGQTQPLDDVLDAIAALAIVNSLPRNDSRPLPGGNRSTRSPGQSMSISADQSRQPGSAELSEADRLAWLRIERALRGMRLWMLLLALIMPAVGLTISSGACIELFVDGVGIVSYWYFFITFFGALGISGIALTSTGVLFAWSFLAIRRAGWLQDSTKVARFLTRYRRAWISLCFSVGLSAVAIVALLAAVFSRFYLEI